MKKSKKPCIYYRIKSPFIDVECPFKDVEPPFKDVECPFNVDERRFLCSFAIYSYLCTCLLNTR